MGTGKATQRLIAERTGLSVPAVSRALRRPRDSDKTAQAVHAAADAVGYRKTASRRGTQSREAYVFGAVDASEGMLHPRTLTSMSRSAARFQGHLLTTSAPRQVADQLHAVDLLISRRVDGIFVMGGHQIHPDGVELALTSNVPVVVFDSRFDNCASVTSDSRMIRDQIVNFVVDRNPDQTWLISDIGPECSQTGALQGLGQRLTRLGFRPNLIAGNSGSETSSKKVARPIPGRAVVEVVICMGTNNVAVANDLVLARQPQCTAEVLIVDETAARSYVEVPFARTFCVSVDPAVSANAATATMMALVNGQKANDVVCPAVVRSSSETRGPTIFDS